VTHVLLQEGHLWERKKVSIPVVKLRRAGVTAASLDARGGLPGVCERRLVRAPGQRRRLTHLPGRS
jgi:hypothetical protein